MTEDRGRDCPLRSPYCLLPTAYCLLVFFWMWAFLLVGCRGMVNHHATGVRLLEQGRLPEAWEAFEKGYEQDPRSPYSLNNMGLVLEMRDGDLIGAAQRYREAIQACEAIEGDVEVKRLEKMARENLQRVLYKIRTNPMRHVSARDP